MQVINFLRVYCEHKRDQRHQVEWAKTELNLGIVRRFFLAMK